MQILSRMSGNRHRAGLRRVMILAMTAARADMKPAVVFNLPDNFPDFHASKNLRRLRSRLIFQRSEDAFENPFAILATEGELTSAFGMRHQAGHVAPLVADARDVLQRAVGIRRVGQVSAGVAVLPEDLVVRLELGEGCLVGKVTALTVGDGHAKNLSRRNLAAER